MAVKKSSYRFLQISTIVFFVFIVFSFIGGLIIFNSKDFGTNVTVMNQMPEVPVSINNSYSNNFDNKIDNEYRNNYTININIDDDIAEMIADEVLDIIKNETD